MSQVSPVKSFDKPEESLKGKDNRNIKRSEKPSLKIIRLESVIEKQQKELVDLKKVIVTKECENGILASSFNCAYKLLTDVKNDKIKKSELEQFLLDHGTKKRKSEVSDKDETKTKRIKLEDAEKFASFDAEKLASFDVEEPQVMKKKRKIDSETEVLLLIFLQ